MLWKKNLYKESHKFLVHAWQRMRPPFSFSPSSSSSPHSLLRTKPRLSSYLFTLLAFILLATILYAHDFAFIFHPHLQNDIAPHPPLLFSTPGELTRTSSESITERNNTVQKVEEKTKECDVFSGRWVRDELTRPLYEESECPYIQPQLTCQQHGRPDKSYRQWRWQPNGCDLPL